MLTLAVDTAADFGSLALADETGVLDEVSLSAPTGFAQVLFGELESLLTRNNVKLADVELYAASTGPGSFTGVRIGLAAIKGLAEVAGRPAIGISSLEALAEYGSAPLRAPVIDARRGEVFAALYDADGVAIIPPSVLPLAAFISQVNGRNAEYISAGFDPGLLFTNAPRNVAGVIALLAIRRQKAGVPCDPASIEGDYVRRSDAEIFWKA